MTVSIQIIDIESLQNILLKVCDVSSTSTGLQRLLFLLRPLTVLMKQTRQAVHTIKQSILLRCLWFKSTFNMLTLLNLAPWLLQQSTEATLFVEALSKESVQTLQIDHNVQCFKIGLLEPMLRQNKLECLSL